MEIAGVKLGAPAPKLICFPRTNPETGEEYEIPFMCGAVLDFSEFNEAFPEPKPGKIRRPGKEEEDDFENPAYRDAVMDYSVKKIQFMLLKSLESTEGLTWNKVKIEDPETWELWKEEMAEVGFTEMEISKLQLEVMQANAFDDETLNEAKANFLRRQAEAKADA